MRRTIAPLPCLILCLAVGCTADNPDLQNDAGTDGSGGDLAQGAPDLPGGGGDMNGGQGNDLRHGGGADMRMGALTLDQACAEYAMAACDRLDSCASFELQLLYGDAATCAARLKISCLNRGNAHGTGFGATRTADCARALGGASCEDYLNPGSIAECRPAAGTLAEGDVCGDSSQCTSAYCQVGASGCGKCVKAGAEGDACSRMAPCGVGLSCVGGKCAAPGGKDATCGPMNPPCKTGYYCNMGKCAAQRKSGDMCTPGPGRTECKGSDGLYCDFMSRKCTAAALAKTGESCGTFGGPVTLCAGGGRCSALAMGTCEAPAKDGDMCDPRMGPGCMSPAGCTLGTCTVFDPGSCM